MALLLMVSTGNAAIITLSQFTSGLGPQDPQLADMDATIEFLVSGVSDEILTINLTNTSAFSNDFFNQANLFCSFSVNPFT